MEFVFFFVVMFTKEYKKILKKRFYKGKKDIYLGADWVINENIQ